MLVKAPGMHVRRIVEEASPKTAEVNYQKQQSFHVVRELRIRRIPYGAFFVNSYLAVSRKL